jgi:leucyl-tRNA synthetase
MHAPDGRRMSKSKHNSITPDSVVKEYGADTLRGYILFLGPFDGDALWDPKGINGIHRWLGRVWDLAQPPPAEVRQLESDTLDLQRAVHKTIKRVSRDMADYQFNTAIAAMMELTNYMARARSRLEGSSAWNFAIETLLVMLAPIAPHLSEELWHRHGHVDSIHREAWPSFDESLTVDEIVTVVVQVNGKVRDRLSVPVGEHTESVEAQALASRRVQPYVNGRKVVKIVAVPNKLINIVVK